MHIFIAEIFHNNQIDSRSSECYCIKKDLTDALALFCPSIKIWSQYAIY